MSSKCGVCNTHIARYQCPLCQLQYCCVECYKRHNRIHVDAPSLIAAQVVLNGLPPKGPGAVTSTGVPDSQIIGRGSSFGNYPLSILETSDDLHTLYDRYPQLRCQLKLIYDAVTEPLDDQLDDSHERSNRRRGRGGNRGQGRDGRTVAKRSRQKGIKAGIQQLRILRHLNGEDGDGLEEFSKLVASLPENNESRNKAPGV